MTLSSPITETGLQITITPILLFSILALLVAVWLVYSIIVRYHWKNYGTKGVEVLTMNIVYIVGSLILIGFTTISAVLYFFSSSAS